MHNHPSSYPSSIGLPLPGDDELLKAFDLNVSRMLAGTQDMSWGFLALVHAIFGTKDIDAAMREIIGLRVAKVLNVPYQWQQHATMGRNAGLSAATIDAVASDSPVAGIASDHRLLCNATDELTRDAILSDTTLNGLGERYGDVVTRKIVLTIGFFNMLSRFLNGCRVPLETHDKMGDRTSPY